MGEALSQQQIDEEFRSSIDGESEKWHHSEGKPESMLLRLALLREIAHKLHAQKSRCLASGRRDLSTRLKQFEQRLYELRNQPKLEGDPIELITGTGELRKRTRLLPEAIYTAIPRDKLERYDRAWESAIAAVACSMGWQFWALEAWVEITLVEEWDHRLHEQLWPSAIVLFVEPASLQGGGPSRTSSPTPLPASAPGEGVTDGPEFPLWHGKWLLAVQPGFKSPSELASNLPQWPGSPSDPPDPVQWKLLFSPKIR